MPRIGIYEGNTLKVNSFINKEGQEQLYKNGIDKSGQRYSFFKVKDSVKSENGNYIQFPYTYIIFTSKGEYLEKGTQVKINKILSVTGGMYQNKYFQITIRADVEIVNANKEDYVETNDNEYIGVDTIISDDDLPF